MNRISIPVCTRFEIKDKLNDEFLRYKCNVLAIGKNRNGSYISRQAVENALDTFKNIPVIAFMYEGDDGEMHVAGHEQKLIESDGVFRFITACRPYGVVPGDDFAFEDVVEPDGSTATYLTCSVIIWAKKYPEIMNTVYSNSEPWAQSMEIVVNRSKEFNSDTRYIEIEDFSASALCLLGKSDDPKYNVDPCFPSDAILSYSSDEHFFKLVDEFTIALSECFSDISKHENNNGGVDEVNKNSLDCQNIIDDFCIESEAQVNTDKFTATAEKDSSFENMVEEVLESDTKETTETSADVATNSAKQEIEESIDEIEEPIEEPSKFDTVFASYNQKREMIAQALASFDVRDEDNEHFKSHWAADFDDTYIYVEYHEYVDGNSDHGFGRVAYSINEDEQVVYLTGELEKMYIKWLTEDELETLGRERDDFVAYKASHSTSNEEVDALREFKEQRLAEDHRIEVENVLSQFEDLDGNAEFEELKKDAISYSDMNELENQCYAIRGRTVRVNFSAKPKSAPIPIVNNIPKKQSADDVYGGLFSMYGYNKN